MGSKGKAETFIGFAVRANKFRTGLNTCGTLKRVNLFLLCNTASQNTLSEAKKLAKKYHTRLLQTKAEPLDCFTHKVNVKIMAITDRALAEAILNNSENDFIEIELDRN